MRMGLESPLTELGLIKPVGKHGGFRFVRGQKPSLGLGTFSYAVTDFWSRFSVAQTLSFEALAHEPGSPGRVFSVGRERRGGPPVPSGGRERRGLQVVGDSRSQAAPIRTRELRVERFRDFVGCGLQPEAEERQRVMALADHVHIARRFQRAIRIDTDLTSPSALEGFICPRSSADVLETMARHVAGTGQGAFTWTGPYGSGKSSLAVALSALLNGSAGPRRYAGSILGGGTATAVWDALPPRTKGWRILPVVGRRDSAAQVVGEAISTAGFQNGKTPRTWSEKRALECLQQLAKEQPRAGGGLMVFIDEMGKFLEAAAYDGTDIYFFQQLAEIASRSAGRLIVIGILHQAFEEYAHRLSREARDEWSKIQGRFVDLAINVSGNEQIDLLGRAIESDRGSTKPGPLAEGVASLVSTQASPDLPQMLEDCWPLHPGRGVFAGTHVAATFRSEPTQYLRVSQFDRAAWVSRLPAPRWRWRSSTLPTCFGTICG